MERTNTKCDTMLGMATHRTKVKRDQLTGAMAERATVDGRRRMKLNRIERRDILRRRKIELAVALLLDLENPKSQREIADALGISVNAYKDLTRSQDYQEVYNQAIVDIQHDPRFRFIQGQLVELLPHAAVELKKLIIDDDTPPGVRLKAIEALFKTTNMALPKTNQEDDREELTQFLLTHEVKVVVDDEYQKAMQRYTADAVDGEFRVKELPKLTG